MKLKQQGPLQRLFLW